MRKLVIASGSFLFRVFCVLVLFSNVFVLGVYAYIRCRNYGIQLGDSVELIFWQKVALISGVVLFFLFGVTLYWPVKKKLYAIPSRRALFRRIFSCLSVAFFLYLLVDGPPPKKTFGREYFGLENLVLNQPWKELDILFNANETDVPDLKFLNRDQKYMAIEIYEDEIEDGWKRIADQKAVVDRLASGGNFLHNPDEGHSGTISYSGLKVASIYQSHALLRARQGDLQDAVESLAKFHDVTCKGLEGSVDLIQKMIWIAIAKHNMRTALQLVREYDLNDSLRSILAAKFDSLTDEEVSFVEFLFALSRQKNRSHQLLDDFWVPIIHTAMTETYGTQVLDEKDFYPPVTLRNIGGWFFCQPPQYLAYEKRMRSVEAISELFHEYLVSGETEEKREELHDKVTGDLRDPGDDGQLHTADDIVLELYYPVRTVL